MKLTLVTTGNKGYGRMETLDEKVARAVKEEAAVVPYDPRRPALFNEEKEHLLSCLPAAGPRAFADIAKMYLVALGTGRGASFH